MKIDATPDGITFSVRVQPRADADRIVGEYQDALKIRLTAPPVDDRANEALRRFLAAGLKVPLAAVTIISGEHSRTKRVQVRGVSAALIRDLASGAA